MYVYVYMYTHTLHYDSCMVVSSITVYVCIGINMHSQEMQESRPYTRRRVYVYMHAKINITWSKIVEKRT
jgi:hypothetical protein